MIKKVIRLIFAPIGGALGYWLWMLAETLLSAVNISLYPWAEVSLQIALISAMAVTGYFIGKPISKWLSQMLQLVTKRAKEMPAKELSLAVFGLLVGFVGAYLICQVFRNITNEILVTCINALIYICCGFLGVRVALLRRDDFNLFDRRKKNDGQGIFAGGTVLDSSILIDGRVFDILKTGFLAEPIYVPRFVLDELTRLSDSEDNKKRTRGRIGLDTVKKLQENNQVQISTQDYPDEENLDGKIIRFAKEKQLNIMTNDYSLNMVASVQGVKILNINELVNALKPTVVAGDELAIEISKVGKEHSQGVGYLDDGTMVVVENGAEYVDKVVNIIVTSMLQTNAGKIIFGKIK